MLLYIPHGTRPTNDAEAILLAELLAATATTRERRAGFWILIGRKCATYGIGVGIGVVIDVVLFVTWFGFLGPYYVFCV